MYMWPSVVVRTTTAICIALQLGDQLAHTMHAYTAGRANCCDLFFIIICERNIYAWSYFHSIQPMIRTQQLPCFCRWGPGACTRAPARTTTELRGAIALDGSDGDAWRNCQHVYLPPLLLPSSMAAMCMRA